jgi:hypothetical protein
MRSRSRERISRSLTRDAFSNANRWASSTPVGRALQRRQIEKAAAPACATFSGAGSRPPDRRRRRRHDGPRRAPRSLPILAETGGQLPTQRLTTYPRSDCSYLPDEQVSSRQVTGDHGTKSFPRIEMRGRDRSIGGIEEKTMKARNLVHCSALFLIGGPVPKSGIRSKAA